MVSQAGALQVIANVTLGSDTTFDIQNIPGSFSVLRLIAYLRSAVAGTGDVAGVRFNNDSATNYGYEKNQSAGTAATQGSVNGSKQWIELGYTAGNTATANEYSSLEMVIPWYAGSGLKYAHTLGGDVRTVGAGGEHTSGVGQWNSTAAITRIQIIPVGGGASFKAGSKAVLYGML